MHNINFLFTLMKRLRKAIQSEALPEFLQTFLNNIYSQEKQIPDWVQYALEVAKIDIQLEHPFFDTEEKLYEDLVVEASKSKE